jgi:hypothetical protein
MTSAEGHEFKARLVGDFHVRLEGLSFACRPRKSRVRITENEAASNARAIEQYAILRGIALGVVDTGDWHGEFAGTGAIRLRIMTNGACVVGWRLVARRRSLP